MAKDLPYFKFNVSEWNDGDITLCSMEAQGLFINLCSLYWSQRGDLSIAKCKRRYSGCNASAWKELVNEQIIKINGDKIIIWFLDEQFSERKSLSEQNTQNALERWKKDATAQQPHTDGIIPVSNIEERRGEEKKEEEKKGKESDISLSNFEKLLNDDSLWMDTIKIVHKGKDIQQAIKNSYLHLQTKKRLARGELSDFKACVQSFLNNEKPGNGQSNGKSKAEQIEEETKRKLGR